MILASAVPEIILGAKQFRMSHATLTMPLCFVIIMMGLDIAYLCTKFDD